MTSPNGPPPGSGVCVLLSGGVDSALLLHVALSRGLDVAPLFLRAGFIWEEAEAHWLRKLTAALASPSLKELKIVPADLSPVLPRNWALSGENTPDAESPDEAVYLPGRNLYLFSIGAIYCQSAGLEEIWIGSLKHNPFPDTSDAFFSSFEATCRAGLDRPVRIRAPFRDRDKTELIRQFPDFPYELSFSCIHPRGFLHCGSCNKCEERRRHLKEAGIRDKTKYA